jgi:probable DNA metabolism protein
MDEDFMIYDEKRRILSIKKDKKMQILYDIDVKYTERHEEKEIIKLWKSFFDKIEITERRNKKLQLQKVPKKYRKNIIEFNDKI